MPGYHLPLFAAEATGIWQEHGLDVELVDPFPGPDNAKAVAAGRYDACLTSVAHYLRARREEPGRAARFVFMIARRPHIAAFVIEGRPADHGRPIVDFADLAGASFIGALPFYRAGVELYGSGLVVADRLLETRPDAVRRLTDALRAALLATRDDP